MATSLALSIKIGAAIGGALAALGGLKKTMDRCAQATRTLTREHRELGQKIQQAIANHAPASYVAHLTRQYDRQARSIEELKLKTRELGRVQNIVAAQEAKRGAMRTSIMETAGIAYLAAKPLRVGIEFEASMSKVQALTRLDKNSPEMKALTEQARKLGAETSFTASEAAQAQGFLAMAGFKPEQILASMPSMLDLAKAGGIDLQRTADIASNIQTAYKLDASQMTRIADTLTMAFTSSNVDLEMLSQTMKYVGPVAKAAGMSLEEAASMSGMLGNAGIQADMAGTALRGMLSKISGTGAKKLQALGVSTKDAAGNMRSLPEILKDLQEKTAKMGSADRVKTLFSIFDQRAAPAVMALLDNVKDIQPYIDTVTNSAGAAAKTHQIMADNMQGDLKTLVSAWEDVSISLTNTQNGPLRGIIMDAANLLRAFGKWIERNQELVGWILKIITAMLALKIAFLAVGYSISLIITPFVKLYGFVLRFIPPSMLLSISKGLSSVAGILRGALVTGLQIAGRAILFIGRALLMNPIGLAVTAIALAAYAVYTYWEPIKAFFAGLWVEIKNAFSGGIGGIAALILNWSPLGLFYSAFAAVMNWFGFEMPAKFTEFGLNIIQGIGKGIDSAKEWLMEKIKSIADMLPDSVRSVLGIASPSTVFAEMGAYSMQGLAEGLQNFARAPLAAAQNIATALVAAGSIGLAASPVAAAAPASATGDGMAATITINVYAAPGMDEKALADLVARKLGDAQRATDASRRGRLADAD